MFEKIIAAIATTLPNIEVGDTGYMDKTQWSAPVKGTDKYGRPFFAIPFHVKNEHRYGGEGKIYQQEGTNMVTFFQRYSSDPNIWVTGDSHGHESPTLSGALKNPSNGNLEDMLLQVLKGETITFLYANGFWDDGTYFKMTARMLTPEEIAKQPKEKSFLEACGF